MVKLILPYEGERYVCLVIYTFFLKRVVNLPRYARDIFSLITTLESTPPKAIGCRVGMVGGTTLDPLPLRRGTSCVTLMGALGFGSQGVGILILRSETMDESAETRDALMERFEERKAKNEGRVPVNNSRAPAGSPMVYDCLACGDSKILPESHNVAAKFLRHCNPCLRLIDLGLLT